MKQEFKSYNEKGDATHYDSERLNTIIKMERIWGTEAIMTHCEITAFKYRERLGKKEGQPMELDLLKAQWYEQAAKYFFAKITNGEAVPGLEIKRYGLPWK